MIWILAWLASSIVGGLAWSWWWHRSKPVDQWRKYRGVMTLRDPASDKLDLSELQTEISRQVEISRRVEDTR